MYFPPVDARIAHHDHAQRQMQIPDKPGADPVRGPFPEAGHGAPDGRVLRHMNGPETRDAQTQTQTMEPAPGTDPLQQPRPATRASSAWQVLKAVFVLVKAPLTLMAAFPAATAYLLSTADHSAGRFLLFLLGTLFSAFGSAAFNQWSERTRDAEMDRTRGRPIPTKVISPGSALALASLFSASGLTILFAFLSSLAGIFALATIVLYWLVYTPMKHRTPWCTEVGAIAGALPALLGAAAATGTVTPAGWSVFAIVLFWQMPHFHPIAWRYRRDYGRAGFRMLAVVDGTGRQAANRSLFYAILTLAASATPILLGAGPVYWLPATAAGAYFLFRVIEFCDVRRRDEAAGRLFRFSLVYLTVILCSLLLDHGLRIH